MRHRTSVVADKPLPDLPVTPGMPSTSRHHAPGGHTISSNKHLKMTHAPISPPQQATFVAIPTFYTPIPTSSLPFDSLFSSSRSPLAAKHSHSGHHSSIHAPTPHRPFVQAVRAFLKNPFGLYNRPDPLLDSIRVRQSLYVHADPVPGPGENAVALEGEDEDSVSEGDSDYELNSPPSTPGTDPSIASLHLNDPQATAEAWEESPSTITILKLLEAF